MDTDTRYVRYFKMEAIRYKMNAFSWSTEMGRKCGIRFKICPFLFKYDVAIAYLKQMNLRQYYLYQYLVLFAVGVIVVVVEFLPTHRMQFLETDITISHTCGNTVKCGIRVASDV